MWNPFKRKTDEIELYRKLWLDECDQSARFAEALESIVCQETASANATVKRMAKMAREAIG